jgi:hypothetical protein
MRQVTTIDFLDTGKRIGIEVEPAVGRLSFGRLAERRAEFL